ncbi:hypothetical protein SLS57_008615 [Botryosphaeria dothidea]
MRASAPAFSALLMLILTVTFSLALPMPLPPLRNLPRAEKGQIDYTRDLLDPILCPATGTGACAAQCGHVAAGLSGACDANGNCICADGQGPVRQTGLREQS